jgi:hypothetical protein
MDQTSSPWISVARSKESDRHEQAAPISKLSDNPLARRAAGKLREGHSQLTSKAIETVLLEGRAGAKRLSLPRKLVGLALMRVATRSVPGAILWAARCWPSICTTGRRRMMRKRRAKATC